MTKAIIHTDGGARGNPGPAAIGVVIEIDKHVHLFKRAIGHATNNKAEYEAVITALTEALKLNVEEVDLYLDSELVQQQLLGNYKVKHPDLAPLFMRVWNLRQQFKKVNFTHVRREQNKAADKLVNEALDEK